MSAEPLERPAGEIDLVAEPVQYPRTPLLALLVIALIPAIALYLVFSWADDEADEYEATRDAVALVDGQPRDRGWFAPDLRGGVDADRDGVRDDEDGTGEESAVDDAVTDADGADEDGTDVAGPDENQTDPDADGGAADDSESDAAAAGAVTSTAIFDYRRTPAAVGALVDVRQLGEAVDPVFTFLGDTSCGIVSVGGIPASVENPDLPVIPASVQKLVVAAVALDVLGPDHRFTTSVAVPRPVDGVVDGDIYLIGGGDPLLTSDDFPVEEDSQPAFNTTSFDALADAVVAAGVTRIRGTVIGDGTRYDDEFFVAEWAEGIAGVDAGPYDALLANDGRVLGRSSREDDPNEGAAREFARLLGNRGVQVDNGWGSGVSSSLVPVVGTVESAPLTAVLEEMLITSDNNTAELLLKEIGVVGAGEGTRAAGVRVVFDRLSAMGLPMDGVVVNDGSGLSTRNRVTCSLIVGLLQRLQSTSIPDSLPIAGRTGTLADEFETSPMIGRLRAKTGTLNNEPFDVDPPAVKSLAGYVTSEGADPIEFVMIVNDSDISLETRYRPLWEAFGLRVDTYPAGPGAETLGPK